MAAYVWSGLAVFAVSMVVLELTIAPLVWTVLADFGHAAGPAVLRVSPLLVLGIMSVVGGVQLLGGWVLLVGLLVLLTSPLVRGWSDGHLAADLADRLSPRRETKRRFEEIVAGLSAPDDDLPG